MYRVVYSIQDQFHFPHDSCSVLIDSVTLLTRRWKLPVLGSFKERKREKRRKRRWEWYIILSWPLGLSGQHWCWLWWWLSSLLYDADDVSDKLCWRRSRWTGRSASSWRRPGRREGRWRTSSMTWDSYGDDDEEWKENDDYPVISNQKCLIWGFAFFKTALQKVKARLERLERGGGGRGSVGVGGGGGGAAATSSILQQPQSV